MRGHLDGLILSVLEDGPRHGYAIIEALQARSGGAFDVPEEGVSIASSPVVLATVEPAARKLGWPQKLDWHTILSTEKSKAPIRTGISDPGHSPVGLSGLIAIDRATAKTDNPGPNRVAALRQVSKNVSAVASDLFGKLPVDDDPTTLSTSMAAPKLALALAVSHASRTLGATCAKFPAHVPVQSIAAV